MTAAAASIIMNPIHSIIWPITDSSGIRAFFVGKCYFDNADYSTTSDKPSPSVGGAVQKCTGGIEMRQPTNNLGKRRDWRALRKPWLLGAGLSAILLLLPGCTTLRDYIQNGFKVGPNYARPPGPVAERWIDANDKRVRSEAEDDSHWWTVFNDPILSDLIQSSYNQNLTVREVGFRVLQARASLGIAIGELFPQQQVMTGDYTRRGVSENVANRVATPQRWFSTWNYGFGLAWELDFWGRFRRGIEAAEDTLDASVEDYDDVLVTLFADVATNYVQYRILDQQLAYARANVKLQTEILKIANARFAGGQVSKLDVSQAQSNLSATEMLVPQLETAMRETTDRLCLLLGIPPEDLRDRLGTGSIPTAPSSVGVGIPGDLLRRRPDVRRVERQAAAQSANIGVADAEFYPQIMVNGTLGWSAEHFKDWFASGSFRGSIGPAFNWEILNYGRILNNVRRQDARFQELAAQYQQTALNANTEAEDALVHFLKSQDRTKFAKESVDAQQASVKEAIIQYNNGLTDFNRVAVLAEQLVDRQTQLAQSEGDIALGLIQVYRALGGGWQIRCDPNAACQVHTAASTEALRPPYMPGPQPPAPPNGAKPAPKDK
jgi:NodT family efflux transporter outer membrane factor (OMF) lipoprotein